YAVDENVGTAPLLHDPVDERLCASWTRQVNCDAKHLATIACCVGERPQLGDCLLHGLSVQAREGDGRAAGGETSPRGQADAATTARDDHDLPMETVVQVSPRSRSHPRPANVPGGS